jgi:Carboxypeptidase regulatory-like domain
LKSFRSFYPLLLIICLTIPASPQSTDATLSGVVVDLSGKIIIDATVETFNEATGLHYFSKTNDAGIYTVSLLPPGQYRAQVSKLGFKTIIKPGITLNVQSALVLNFTLPVGATSESVTVDAGASLINTTDASVSTVIESEFVQNIPLNGRSFQDLISLTPGVVTQSPQNQAGGTIGNAGDFSVNGQRTESNYYMVDGVAGNTSSGNPTNGGGAASSGSIAATTALGTTQSLISVDALQEFRVESSTYSAEFGRTPGGQFSLATRSGGNTPHGSVFNYLRNNFFDANDWFNDHYGVATPALRQNDFGGTFGGPVWLKHLYDGHSRTFFFVSYEGLRLTQPQAATIQYVPSLSLRQSAAPALQPILEGFPLPTGAEVQVACDGLYVLCPPGEPVGTVVPSGLAQFIQPYSLPSSVNATSVRIDDAISPKLSLFFRTAYTPSSTFSRVLSNVTETQINTETDTLGATSQFSKLIENEFRLGYARGNTQGLETIDNFGGAAPVNLADAMGIGGYGRTATFFSMYVLGVGSTSLSTFNPLNESRQWNLTDTLSRTSGRHQFKLGIDYRHIRTPFLVSGNPYVEFDFLTEQAIQSNSANFAEFSREDSATPLFNETSVFAQDNWRAARNLSIALGVRWELDPAPTEAHGNDAFTLLGNLSDPITLALAPRGTPLWKTSWFNLAPRLGIAWSARTRPGWETVLRTGGGVFFDTDNELAANAYSGVGFVAYQDFYGISIPATPAELNFSPSTAPPYTGALAFAFPAHLQLPYTLNWSTSLEQALGKSQALNLSYIGSAGRRLIQLRRYSVDAFNPDFGSIDALQNSVTSNYQALQVQFQRSAGKGLRVLGAYTWSHSLDFGSSDVAYPATRGNSDFDVRNNFTAGATWSLPQLHSNRWVDEVLDHWDVDARFSARTGFPITLYGNLYQDPATGNTYYGNLNIVPGQSFYRHGSAYPGGRAINPGAFSFPTGNGLGDAPRNFLRGFGEEQFNFATTRKIPLNDRLDLQFRAEAFNLLNHPNFGYINPYLTEAQFGLATEMLNQSLTTMSSLYQQGGPRSMQFALKLTF